MKFKVWCPNYNERGDAQEIEAFDAEHAAEDWAEINHSKMDYFDNIGVVVIFPDGTEKSYFVEVESEPVFRATEAKEEA